MCAATLVVSREKIQFLVVGLQNPYRASGPLILQPPVRWGMPRPAPEITIGWLLPALQPFSACPQSVLLKIIGLAPCRNFPGGRAKSERKPDTRFGIPARCGATAILLLFGAVNGARAQQPAADPNRSNLPSAPVAQDEGKKPDMQAPDAKTPSPTIVDFAPPHRFFDRENLLLFGAVAGGRGLDYASTLNLRHRGINEALLTNGIVDNHALFAVIEVAATGASVGVSYIFHRTGHHRLERWTSAIHAGIAVGGAIRNYNLKAPKQ